MSTKFFTFLHGGAVHIAPKTKLVKKEALSSLLDAKELIVKTEEDAINFKKEAVAASEKEKELAIHEGFEEGFSKWAEKLVELEQEIARVRADMEKIIVPVALKAAQKIVGRELETSKTVIADIVKNALKSVSQHKKITVWANKDDLVILEKEREDLKKLFEKLESFTLRPRDDIASGGCVIETEGGIINAKLDNQWLILESAFERMMLQAKEGGR